MDIITSYYSSVAIVFSIVGLAVAPLLPLFFNQYFRGLQFLQMCYLFALAMNTKSFSGYLTTATVDFNKNILTFCTTGDFVCTNGFRLSLSAILFGLLFVTFLFVQFRKCCGKEVEFQPVYRTLKGFIKWIYVPLVTNSTIALLKVINLTTTTIDLTTILAPAIVLGFLALLPFIQLIVLKCIQKENTNIWIKWLEFFGYLRLLATSILIALYIQYVNVIYLHLVMIMVIINPILHVWKGDFKYPVMERIIFILGEAAFLSLYYLFKYQNDNYIYSYNLDLFLLGAVLLLDTILYLVRTLRLVCFGSSEGVSDIKNNLVQPEGDIQTAGKIELSSRGVAKVVGKVEQDSTDELKNSRDFKDAVGKKTPQPLSPPPKKKK